jgi:hypothetical protein
MTIDCFERMAAGSAFKVEAIEAVRNLNEVHCKWTRD